MSKIEVGFYSELLRRFLSQAGQESVSGELSPEISPVMVLDSVRPDWAYLRGERMCGGSVGSAPAAALNSTVRLVNPAGSGMLLTICDLQWWNNAIDNDIVIRVDPTTVTGEISSNQGQVLDTRWNQRPQALIAVNNTLTIAAAGGSRIGQPLPGTINSTNLSGGSWTHPIVLSPDHSVIVMNTTVNVRIDVGFVWMERRQGAYEI